MTPAGNATAIWNPSTTDTHALQKIGPAIDRIAACWYSSTTFSIALQFNDGKPHQVALYLYDFDNYRGGRAV